MDLIIKQELLRNQQLWIDNLVRFSLKISDQQHLGLHISSEAGRIKFSAPFERKEWTMLGDLEPVFFENMAKLALKPEDAKKLQRELARLWEEYTARNVPGQRVYLFRLGLLEAHV
ncbi:MAG: hypothetical protein ACRCYY_04420 [Trueperaceae bacterium]